MVIEESSCVTGSGESFGDEIQFVLGYAGDEVGGSPPKVARGWLPMGDGRVGGAAGRIQRAEQRQGRSGCGSRCGTQREIAHGCSQC